GRAPRSATSARAAWPARARPAPAWRVARPHLARDPRARRELVPRPGIRAQLRRPCTADAGVAFVRALGHVSADTFPHVLLGSWASASRAAALPPSSGART